MVDIRVGKRPRPAGIEGIYWDLRAANVNVGDTPGESVALLDLMKRAGFSEAELAKLAEANQKSTHLVRTELEAMNLVKGLVADGNGGFVQGTPDPEKARELVHNSDYHRNKADVMLPISDFFQLLDARTSGAIAAAEERAANWRMAQIISSVVMLALFFAAFYGIFNRIIASIRRAVQVTDAVAKGDLTQDIHAEGRDEVAHLLQSLSGMQTGLVKVVSTVRSASDSVATASSEIAQGHFDLSSRTESQASALEETASSMEEITGAVQNNAENARTAEQHAMTTSEVASKGGEAFRRVVETMDQISQSSHRIVDIIGVIDGIAFQTNLLALNAAVEAARAGDEGRGFAVVAAEVRNLAQRSAEAAREIKQLIETSANNVDFGVSLVKQAGETMEEIVNSVGRVTTIMKDITSASNEQAAGISEVNIAITQMDQVTQENAALVEQATAATKAMEDQCRQLTDAVAIFRLDARSLVPIAAALSVTSSKRPSRPLARFAQRAPAATPAVTATAAPAMRPKKAAGSGEDWEEF